MNREEFLNKFPDADSCKRFLFDLKWKDSYKCKKCGYSKGAEKPNFSYKCNKCYHIESCTAHTFLHNNRFGIHKAFCMINDVIELGEGANSTHLVLKHKVSRVSVLRFLKKIPERKIEDILIHKKGILINILN